MTRGIVAFDWYAAAPSDVAAERAALTLGLRSAELWFNELVTPGIGRVWFVRQLSWAVGGLAIAEHLQRSGRGVRASQVAIAIEALGCKLAWDTDPDDRSGRVIGTRAFARDRGVADAWEAKTIRRREHYVQNTWRAGTVRALREDGLGFATGTRYDGMRLTRVGRELADAFLDQPAGQGKGSLDAWLARWLDGGRSSWGKNVAKALSPHSPSAVERRIVRDRLPVGGAGGETRAHLLRVIGASAEVPDVREFVAPALERLGRVQQAKEVRLAASFGAMLDGAHEAVAAVTRLLYASRQATPAKAALEAEVARALEAVAEGAREYVRRHAALPGGGHEDAWRFAKEDAAVRPADLLERIVRRDGQVLALSDGAIHRGALFRRIDAVDRAPAEGGVDEDARSELRSFRLANLLALARDAKWRNA